MVQLNVIVIIDDKDSVCLHRSACYWSPDIVNKQRLADSVVVQLCTTWYCPCNGTRNDIISYFSCVCELIFSRPY